MYVCVVMNIKCDALANNGLALAANSAKSGENLPYIQIYKCVHTYRC